MQPIAMALVVGAGLLVGYTYLVYPLVLRVLARPGAPRGAREEPLEWPTVSLSLPVYNEETQIAQALEHLLGLDYPRDRLQILVVSDASTDGTDGIVEAFADRGIELHRLRTRQGKTGAENAAAPFLTGEIVLNTDASIRIHPRALKALVLRLTEPGVGLASGRDISVAAGEEESNSGESGYVGYEMWVRALETRCSGIVGASGCLYAIRADLHRFSLPENLSRDFAAALVTRERGYRSVSVDEATCLVPRTTSLRREYRRKVRTMTRGIRTLVHKRALLNPRRYGLFSWKLFSHKICRWAVPWGILGGALGVVILAFESALARIGLLGILGLAVAAGIGWLWPTSRRMPRLLALPAHLVWSNVAALHACILAPLGGGSAVWEPTRRRKGVRALRP